MPGISAKSPPLLTHLSLARTCQLPPVVAPQGRGGSHIRSTQHTPVSATTAECAQGAALMAAAAGGGAGLRIIQAILAATIIVGWGMRIYRIYIYGCMSQTPKIEIRPFLSVFTLLERPREVQLDG